MSNNWPEFKPAGGDHTVTQLSDLSPQALGELTQFIRQQSMLQDTQGKLGAQKLVGFPSDSTKVLLGDGTWGTSGVSPTQIGIWGSTGAQVLIANKAYLAPIPYIVVPTTITRIGFGIGTSSGNMDVGIYYTDDESTFTRLVSTGSFATPATGMTLKTISSTTLTPVVGRRWFWAFAFDNATATVDLSMFGGACPPGGFTKATSFALPSSITGASAMVRGTDVMPALVGLI